MMRVRRTQRTRIATTVVLAGALALTGCSDSDSGTSGSPTQQTPSPAADHNDADVKFSTQMIPHHQQAVQMSQMAIRKATTPEIKQLAAAIKAAQDPEINQMSGWLTRWGKPVPSPAHGGHSTSEMPGMMTEDEMSDLGNATGSRFDRMFLQMMTRHHQGAVTMARTEQTSGKDTRVIALAKKIETDQNREITTMRKLLTSS